MVCVCTCAWQVEVTSIGGVSVKPRRVYPIGRLTVYTNSNLTQLFRLFFFNDTS